MCKDLYHKDKFNLHPFYHTIELLKETSSTNDYLKQKADCTQEGYVVISEAQTKGKGRNGRVFHSPKHTGIYMSFLIKPSFTIYDTSKISACVSVAVYEAIKKLYHIDSKIKWINDLYIEDKKIAGILCESTLKINSSYLEYMIIGIGINVHTYTMPNELVSIAGSIEDFTNIKHLRSTLITEILNRFYFYYSNFNDSSFMNVYRMNSYVIGKQIKVIENNSSYNAFVETIDDSGFLHILLEDNTKKILTSAEISIRIA